VLDTGFHKDSFKMDLMRTVADGYTELGPLMWHLKSYQKSEQILAWLIQNKVTGKKLLGFWRVQHEGSYLRLASDVLGRIEREKNRVIFSKDLK